MKKKLFGITITAVVVILLSCCTVFAAYNYTDIIKSQGGAQSSSGYTPWRQLKGGEKLLFTANASFTHNISSGIANVELYYIQAQRSRWYGSDPLRTQYCYLNYNVSPGNTVSKSMPTYYEVWKEETQNYRFYAYSLYHNANSMYAVFDVRSVG